MELAPHPYFALFILVPVLMSGLAFAKWRRSRRKEFHHLAEFYLSLGLITATSTYFIPMGSAWVILSMLPWIWAIRTMRIVVEDATCQSLYHRSHYVILGLGGVCSIIFLIFGFGLGIVVAPYSLAVGLIGLTYLLQAYVKSKVLSMTLLQHVNLFFVLGFFVNRLLFPMILTSAMHIFPRLDAYMLIAFCATLYPLYAEVTFERHERFLQEVLLTRNRQLFSHSGFSEFKILSAGLSHEVNNALTIINARISMLLRNRSKDPSSDLQLIQGSTNRIVASIRKLREFIYPSEVIEVLDLGEVILEVLELYGQRLNNHGVKVDVAGLDGKLIRGQKIQLEQVFLSLINNSTDAMDNIEDRWISITGRGVHGVVEITYQDSTPSNASEIVPLLRDPFTSAQQFLDKDIRLVLSKEILEKHSGSMTCLKNPDLSTFLLTLPLTEASRSSSMELQSRLEEISDLH